MGLKVISVPFSVVLALLSSSPLASRNRKCRNAQRDYALIKGSYLLGCRVSGIAAIRWKDIEALDDGGQIHLFGKGSKRRTVRVSPATLGLFQGLGRGVAVASVITTQPTK